MEWWMLVPGGMLVAGGTARTSGKDVQDGPVFCMFNLSDRWDPHSSSLITDSDFLETVLASFRDTPGDLGRDSKGSVAMDQILDHLDKTNLSEESLIDLWRKTSFYTADDDDIIH